MNILHEYTLDYVKKNKHSSIAIIVAIIIATIMLSAVTTLFESQYYTMINNVIKEKGDWHARFNDSINTENMKYLESNPNIDKIMLAAPSYLAKLNEAEKPFIIVNRLNSSSYNNMHNIKEKIIEGRIPQKEDEILISKQFFEAYPNLKVGDTISLPTGTMRNDKMLQDYLLWNNVEKFEQIDTKTLTIVGKWDNTSRSFIPAYLACGYFDDSDIMQFEYYHVTLKFKNPSNTYNEMPKLADNLKSSITYNTTLLAYNFAFNKEVSSDFDVSVFLEASISLLITYMIIILAFIFIIYNAFAVSASGRIKQLSIFKSIGATPKQIAKSITFEATLLSAVGIPIGVFVGVMVSKIFWGAVEDLDNMGLVFRVSLVTIIFSVVFSFITVWISAIIPARRVSKISPIAAIRNANIIKSKSNYKTQKILSIEKDIANTTFKAYKKTYRTAIISLTLAFLLVGIAINAISVMDAKNKEFYRQLEEARDIFFYIWDGNEVDSNFLEQFETLPNVKKSTYYSQTLASINIPYDMQSNELIDIGGVDKVLGNRQYNVSKYDNGNYMITTELIGLKDNLFNNYCNKLGLDYSDYYKVEDIKTIAINTTRDTRTYDVIEIPFLNIKTGDTMSVSEYRFEGDGNSHFNITFGTVTQEYPLMIVDYYRHNFYKLEQIMPLSIYYKIVNGFENPKKQISARHLNGEIKLHDENTIVNTAKVIEEMISSQYSHTDYRVVNQISSRARDDEARKLIIVFLYGGTSLLILIGITNAFSTVHNNTQSRKREIAMLKSVGLTPIQLRKVLYYEALKFAYHPMIIGMPIVIVVTAVLLRLNKVKWITFIPHMPILPMAIFGSIITLSIGLAYYLSSRNIQKESILDAIKNDLV